MFIKTGFIIFSFLWICVYGSKWLEHCVWKKSDSIWLYGLWLLIYIFNLFPCCRFRKPQLHELVTQEYHAAYASEQDSLRSDNKRGKSYNLKHDAATLDDDDISVHCGAEVDAASRNAANSRQGSLLSKLSGKLKPLPSGPDQLSLLENPDHGDGDGDESDDVMVVNSRPGDFVKVKLWKNVLPISNCVLCYETFFFNYFCCYQRTIRC